MRIHINSKDPEIHTALKDCIKPLRKVMNGLKKEYRFQLPEAITLRTLREVTIKNRQTFSVARAGYTPGRGYWIGLRAGILRSSSESLIHIQIAHEAAHITEALKTGKWSHSRLFDEMNQRALRILGVE